MLREARRLLDELGAVLPEVATALRGSDADRARRALRKAATPSG